eukprot:symbB.v1.2.017384.t1/scaffold1357.1/size159079/2
MCGLIRQSYRIQPLERFTWTKSNSPLGAPALRGVKLRLFRHITPCGDTMQCKQRRLDSPSLCARVGGGYIYRPPMTPEKDRSMTRAQSSPALNRIYGERRSGKVRREAERRDSKYEAPELSLVNEV